MDPEIARRSVACLCAFVIGGFAAITPIIIKTFAVEVNAPTSIIAGAISQPVRVTATICAGTISYAVTPTTIAVASIVILELFTSISPIISSSYKPIVAVVPATGVFLLANRKFFFALWNGRRENRWGGV